MDKVIYDVLLVIMLVISAILVISILMQPSKQDGAADAFQVVQESYLNDVKRVVLKL